MRHKWPTIEFSIKNCPELNKTELLTSVLQVFGMYIPVAFRLYKNFETMSDETYELTLGYPQYRQSLTQQIRQSQIKEME